MNDPSQPPAVPAGGRRFRLRASVDALLTRSGDIVFQRPGEQDLCARSPGPLERATVEALRRRSWTLEELAGAVGSELSVVQPVVTALEEAGVLALEADPRLDAGDRERFDRQLPYLADHGDAERLQERVRAAHVAVIGCGGLGCWAAAGLASCGIGSITLVDDDRVERSNLNRQILYCPADLGELKVSAAARWIARFDPRIAVAALPIRVHDEESMREATRGADAVVLAADDPPYEIARWLNAVAIERRLPFIVGGQAPPLVKIGPLYWPGHSPCFTCHETQLRAESAHYDDYVEHARRSPSRGATLGPAAGSGGLALAMELLHWLIGRAPATLGAAVIADMRTLESRRHAIRRDPSCVSCHDAG